MGAACEVLHKGKGVVCVLWCGEGEGSGSGAWSVACAAISFLCTSKLWVRARAGALALVLAAVCEDVRADVDAAADGDG